MIIKLALDGFFRIAFISVIAATIFGEPVAGRELSGEELEAVFPGASFVGAFDQEPPAAPVFIGGSHVGYVLSTLDVVGSTGYAGAPLDVLVGVDLEGLITGAHLAFHSEPILIIGISDDRLRAFVSGFSGYDIRRQVSGKADRISAPDFVAGASVSSAVIQDAIVRATRTVAFSRGILGSGGGERLVRGGYEPSTWSALIADGSLGQMRLTRGEVEDLIADSGAADTPSLSEDQRGGTFIHLYAGLLTPSRIGQNLLGPIEYNRLVARLGPEDHAIIIAAHGLYSFKGTMYRRSGVFDRFQLVQLDRTIRFSSADYFNVEALSEDLGEAAELREIGVFIVRETSGFAPLARWRLELRLQPAGSKASSAPPRAPLVYDLPPRYRTTGIVFENGESGGLLQQFGGENQLWLKSWQNATGRIVGLVILLLALTVILMLQDMIASRKILYDRLRTGFLLVTLLWLGFYAGAQLSVVNALTFLGAMLSGFRWEHFLVDPLAFILWSYVALTMLFWGRGVFCGWLCPFGALQELLNRVAQKFRVPQIRVPFLVHERLWPIKYIVFLGLFAVSLNSMILAIKAAEVEPFKTAITLGFVRHWPFLLYVGILLGAGLFIERFFCRYLCPLGAALAIPARLRMFDWLLRRWQCGRECNICAKSCPVQAIHPDGSINPNECIHCLKCQTMFYDDFSCPPLIAKRKRREKRLAANEQSNGKTADGAQNVY